MSFLKIGVRACSYCGQCSGLYKLEAPTRPWRCPDHKGAHGIPKDDQGRVLSAEQLAERASRILELERKLAPRHLRVSKDYDPLEEDALALQVSVAVLETSTERERVEAQRRSDIWDDACRTRVLQRYILNMRHIDLVWRLDEVRQAATLTAAQLAAIATRKAADAAASVARMAEEERKCRERREREWAAEAEDREREYQQRLGELLAELTAHEEAWY